MRSQYDLAALELYQVVELGLVVRACASDSITVTAQAAIDRLHDALRDAAGNHALVLVRLYRTTRLGLLGAELQRFVRSAAPELDARDDAPCLELLASRGMRPEWNRPEGSINHHAVPLAVAGDTRRFPMVAAAVRGLRLAAPDDPDAPRRVHEAELRDHPELALQDGFVRPFGVRSMFALAGATAGGERFAMIAFCRVPVSPEVAARLELLAPQLELALRTDDAPREPALARALALHEQLVVADGVELAAVRAELAAQAAAAQRSRTIELEQQNRRLERTQRAMLNIVEDLRLARAQLQQKVAERTAELQHANDELRQRNRDLEDFAYIASHDLQEPLRTVSGYLQLIERRYRAAIDDEGREFIGYAVAGVHRMQQLIEGLRSYNRVSTKGRPLVPLPLDEVVDAALQNLAARLGDSGARIEREPLPQVEGDAIQLVQVFQNLIGNSLKFAGDHPPRVEIRATPEGNRWCIEVRDHGLGFDPRHCDKVLKMFTRLRRDIAGTGVGLAICKKIVERHGGAIVVHGEPGVGTRVCFTLPSVPPVA